MDTKNCFHVSAPLIIISFSRAFYAQQARVKPSLHLPANFTIKHSGSTKPRI